MIVNISIIKYLKQPYDEFRVENSIKHFPRFRVTFQDLHSDVGYNSINVGCRPDNELKISLLALRRKVSLQTVNFIILPFRNFHFKRTGKRFTEKIPCAIFYEMLESHDEWNIDWDQL